MVSHCLAVSLNASHCFSLPLTASHCLSVLPLGLNKLAVTKVPFFDTELAGPMGGLG